ncbi:membrane protein (plasmid) [Brevibacillus laterosporus]|uniref:Membrane protein n=2 Tax=Brevibacillus laterosporus TaxID=1465 RepID=A0A0F6Y0I2_BRELA|nr:membrane protein [Brevibacillus laterosporus]
MQITKDMNIANNWFIREPVRYLTSFVVAVVVSILLDKIYKKRDKDE